MMRQRDHNALHLSLPLQWYSAMTASLLNTQNGEGTIPSLAVNLAGIVVFRLHIRPMLH